MMIAIHTSAHNQDQITDMQLGLVSTTYEGTRTECLAAADDRVYAVIAPTMRNDTIGRKLRAVLDAPEIARRRPSPRRPAAPRDRSASDRLARSGRRDG